MAPPKINIEPIEGQHYFITDLGDRIELTSTLFHGLIAGCVKLAAGNYKIIYDSCQVRGNMYIIPALKPEEGELKEDNEYELKELRQQVEVLNKDLRAAKSLIARQKNKLTKLTNDIEETEEEN